MRIRSIAARAVNRVLRQAGLSIVPFNAESHKNDGLNPALQRFVESHSAHGFVRERILHPEVLIPCFNQGAFLEEAVSSVQGVPITIINDASTDETPRLADRLADSPNVRVIHNEKNLKQWGSLNRAIRASPNNLFIVLNADDALLPWTIETVLQLWRTEAEMRLLGAGHVSFSDSDTLRWMHVLPRSMGYNLSKKYVSPMTTLRSKGTNDINMTMSGMSFSRSAWEAVGGFLPFEQRVVAADDRDFQYRVAALFGVTVIDEPFAMYRVGASSWSAAHRP